MNATTEPDPIVMILADQAGAVIRTKFGKPVNVDELERFAELIVKQTMRVVANNLPSNTYIDVAEAVIEYWEAWA